LSDGVLLVDKPAGVTSHDVVAAERRRLAASASGDEASGRGRIKVGHAGTLDPFATGLLLVLVGRATRAQRFLMALPKRYETVARLGFTSTTGDIDGEIAPGRTPPEPLALPTGRIRQRPPAYSAVRVGGRRAYALARAGEPVDVPEREVEVHRFEQLWRDGERAAFAIECGSGTYVRSLIADLGDAYCLELRRTGIGPFDVAEAGRFVPLADALAFLPAVELEGDDARRAGHGVAVAGAAPGTVRLLDADGLIALAEPRADGTLKPVVGFRG
jgi:tRNA pseudouridine55 synthase